MDINVCLAHLAGASPCSWWALHWITPLRSRIIHVVLATKRRTTTFASPSFPCWWRAPSSLPRRSPLSMNPLTRACNSSRLHSLSIRTRRPRRSQWTSWPLSSIYHHWLWVAAAPLRVPVPAVWAVSLAPANIIRSRTLEPSRRCLPRRPRSCPNGWPCWRTSRI